MSSPDRPTFQSGSTSEVFGERLSGAITNIRDSYRVAPYGSSQANALINLSTWLGLYVQHGPENIAVNLMDAVMVRKKQVDPKYKKAMDKLDELTSGCLEGITDENGELWTATKGLDDKLKMLVDELYPEHAQKLAHPIAPVK